PHGRGTGDTASPYGNVSPYNAWLGRHAGQDCSRNGYRGPYLATQYRSGGSLDGTISHGLYTNGCLVPKAFLYTSGNTWPDPGTLMTVTDAINATDCAATGTGTTRHNCVTDGAGNWTATSAMDNSLKINLTSNSAGGGVQWMRQDAFIFPQR